MPLQPYSFNWGRLPAVAPCHRAWGARLISGRDSRLDIPPTRLGDVALRRPVPTRHHVRQEGEPNRTADTYYHQMHEQCQHNIYSTAVTPDLASRSGLGLHAVISQGDTATMPPSPNQTPRALAPRTSPTRAEGTHASCTHASCRRRPRPLCTHTAMHLYTTPLLPHVIRCPLLSAFS